MTRFRIQLSTIVLLSLLISPAMVSCGNAGNNEAVEESQGSEANNEDENESQGQNQSEEEEEEEGEGEND